MLCVCVEKMLDNYLHCFVHLPSGEYIEKMWSQDKSDIKGTVCNLQIFVSEQPPFTFY